MNQHVIDLETIVRVIFPFAAANIFALVFMYFTLVRSRMGASYPYFAIFICCFILFLCSPLIKTITPKSFSLWYVTTKNILLFSVAFPALLQGIFLLAKQPLSQNKKRLLYAVGIIWALYYLAFRIEDFVKNDNLFNILRVDFFTLAGTFVGSTLYIIGVLMFSCLYLLTKKPEHSARLIIYGVLLLSVGIFIGHAFRFWGIMNFICALTALLWCWQIFKDVRKTNQQLSQYHQHEKALAKAQYASAGNSSFNQFYSVEKNIAYPLRERDVLVEVVKTSSTGLIAEKVENLIIGLQQFTHNQHSAMITHVRETLFILVDNAIYSGANKQALTQRLEQKGIEANHSGSITALTALLTTECYYLCQAITDATSQNPEQELVDAIKNYVLTHYFNNISLSDIANAVSTSQSHIMRVFKRIAGQTINQYIVEVRIEKAKLLLLSKSVTESAFEAGFNDSNYFATVFKKKTGITPKQYQQQANE